MDSSGQNYYTRPTPDPSRYSLKWHKFLIYFALWAGAILNAINGINHMTGSIYGAQMQSVYRVYPGIKTPDIIMGIALIALGVFMLIVRFGLAGFKSGAPARLIAVYLIGAGLNMCYTIAASTATGLPFASLVDTTFWTNIASSVLFAVINKVYYGKRAELFVY